jgi:hypothetical protein
MFYEELYDGEWLYTGKYLKSLEKQESWTYQGFKNICWKAYGYFLQEGFLWKHPKKKNGGVLQQVVCGLKDST